MCNFTTTFVTHLVNQAVTRKLIALQVLFLLFKRCTNNFIEIAVGFTREVGAFVTENSLKANVEVYGRFCATFNGGTVR